MEFIAHRINQLEQLQALPKTVGAEIDIRDYGDRLLLAHDPFLTGDELPLESFLAHYKHGTLILNIKSERVEERVLALLAQYQIKNYFFLDSSFPIIVQLSRQGIHKSALRFSEYESLATLKALQAKVRWAWVDCFNHWPLTPENYQQLKQWGYQVCLVSPELQGRAEDLMAYRQQLEDLEIVPDAICAKIYNFDHWMALGRDGE